MPVAREKLLQILIETKAFQWSPTPTFPLASGAMSKFYVDCKVALSYPEARQIVGEMILDLVQGPIDAVGGLLIGAYPIAIAVSDFAYKRDGQILRVFAVRKEPKVHGLKKMIEGGVKEGSQVVIVDDVVTSGGSTIEAIQKSRGAGLVVKHVIAIIDRQEQGGRAHIEEQEVKVDTLCTLRDLQEAAGVRLEAKK
jgi:orotate phosphoribosyltransferase